MENVTRLQKRGKQIPILLVTQAPGTIPFDDPDLRLGHGVSIAG